MILTESITTRNNVIKRIITMSIMMSLISEILRISHYHNKQILQLTSQRQVHKPLTTLIIITFMVIRLHVLLQHLHL